MNTVTKLSLTSSKKRKKFNCQVLLLLTKAKFLMTVKRRSINMIRKITKKKRRKKRKNKRRTTKRKNTKKRRKNKNLKSKRKSLIPKRKNKSKNSLSIQVKLKQTQ